MTKILIATSPSWEVDREEDTVAATEVAEADIANTMRTIRELRVQFKDLKAKRVPKLRVVSEVVIVEAVVDAVAIAVTALRDPTLSGETKVARELKERLKVVLERRDLLGNTTKLMRVKKVVRDHTDLESSSIMNLERMKWPKEDLKLWRNAVMFQLKASKEEEEAKRSALEEVAVVSEVANLPLPLLKDNNEWYEILCAFKVHFY
jgi:hypothetical protein